MIIHEKLINSVEQNIVKLVKDFQQYPLSFLTEADVQCYLYSLLISDPYVKTIASFFIKKPELLTHTIVHAESRGDDSDKKRVDIVIYEPSLDMKFDLHSIGIEIKYNRKEPGRKEKSNIYDDINKLVNYKNGFLIWVNNDRDMDNSQLSQIKEVIKNYNNIRLFYSNLEDSNV